MRDVAYRSLTSDFGGSQKIIPVDVYKKTINENSFIWYTDGIFPTVIFNRDNWCFTGETSVNLTVNAEKEIRSLCVGDIVLSFDGSRELGRGPLVPRRVTRLFRNITTEWIVLTWQENGESRELTCLLKLLG